MKLTKQSSPGSIQTSPQTYLLGVDNDINSICTAFKGMIRFGNATNGTRGENIAGEFRVFTSHATPDTEFVVKHTLGATPQGWLVINKNKAGDLYASTTAWTSSSIAFKCSVASVNYCIFLLK